MKKPLSMLLFTCVALLILAVFAYAQLPPEGVDGVPFFKVNINPTNVPPVVNINPNQYVPRVEVTRMPDIKFPPPAGCEDSASFQTRVGTSIPGPLVVTYLNTGTQTSMTVSDNRNGSQRVSLGSGAQITTAIYVESGQALQFEGAVMYSGCRPE